MAQFQCPKCGKILEKGIPQCPACGAKFNWSNDPNLPKAPAVPQQPLPPQRPQYPQQSYQPQPQQSQQSQQPQYYQQVQVNVTQPKKKSRIGLIIAGVILILLLSCCASMCSSNGSADGNNANAGNASTENGNSKNNNTYQGKGTLGDYEIEILSAKLTKDWEDKDAVIIEFKFTNNSDEPQSFMVAISDKVFQDGIELESAVVTGKDYNVDNQLKEIKTGKSLNVQAAFLLNDTTTPIEVEVSELISFSDKKVVKTFDIAQ